jgi:hypothetical protein
MKKSLLLFASLAFFNLTMTANAQEKKSFAVEPYIGLSMPVRNIGGSDVKEIAGINAGIEARYIIESVPLSVGADLFMTTAARQMAKAEGGHSSNSQRMAGAAAVCEYGFMRGNPVSFYIGTGLGIAQRETIQSGFDNGIGICSTYGPVVSPRVGMELWNHLRLSLEGRFSQRDFNVVAFRLGFAFGGGKN